MKITMTGEVGTTIVDVTIEMPDPEEPEVRSLAGHVVVDSHIGQFNAMVRNGSDALRTAMGSI